MRTTSDENLIAEAGRRLADAAPGAKVILFGSHARGDARSDSDLDLLVIEPEVNSRRAEFVRLREALGNLGVPIDLVVVPASHVHEWGHFEGTMLNDALREGRVLVSVSQATWRLSTHGRLTTMRWQHVSSPPTLRSATK